MFSKQLFGLNKGGTYKVWSITAMGDSFDADLKIEHGVEGGKMTVKIDNFKSGKQGRDAIGQAIFEAQARIKKSLDKNYRETKEELSDIPVLAMLAQDHTKKGKVETVEEGVFTSDKFDGLRALAKCKLVDGVKDVLIESRTGQPYDIPHIKAELMKIMDVGDILDGEIYLHGSALQEIKSAVDRTDPRVKVEAAQKKLSKAKDDDAKQKAQELLDEELEIARIRPLLQFHVFDIVLFDTPFKERLYTLFDYADLRFHGPNAAVQLVKYGFARNMDELVAQHHNAVDRGYEGIMYRTQDGEYESGKRSNGVWKFKWFMDKEFRILRHEVDKNGYAVFVLENDLKHNEFNCVMGDYGWRAEVAAMGEFSFRDQWMTVQFQARFKKTFKPQFPTGKLIRKGEVINGEFVPSE